MTTNNIPPEQALAALGFTEMEAAVYCELLRGGPATGYRLGQAIGKAAANTYQALAQLTQKGAVLVDDSDAKTYRATPPAELLAALERGFVDRRAQALSALETLKPAAPDDRIYQLTTPAQVFERAAAMIQRAHEILIFDLFPEPLERLAPLLAQAHARKVVVAGLAYADAPTLPFPVVCSSSASVVTERWPGQQISLVADAREHLTALLAPDGQSVRHAVWSDSAYLACLKHSGLAAEIRVSRVAPFDQDPLNGVALLRAFPPGLRTLMGPPDHKTPRRRCMSPLPKTRLIQVAALALACFSAAPACADTLSDLVDRYVAWRGGPTFEHLTSVHETGTLETGGLKGTFEAWSERAGRQRTQYDLGVVKQTSVVDAARSWDTSPSGQVENAPDADVVDSLRDAALQFGDALRGRDGAKAMLSPSEARDGRSWSVVHVAFGTEDAYDVFIDPNTGELGGIRVNENRKGRFEGFGDWRVVDGVRMPFLQTVKSDLPGGDSTARIEKMELNHAFQADLFGRPGVVRRAGFANGATGTGWIPFEFFGGNRIYFPAKVNGHAMIVLLDSGAESSVIDRAYAATLGMNPKGGITGAGAGGYEAVGVIDNVTVEVGDLRLGPLTIGALNLAPVGKRIGHPLPFVLGDELFNELAVDIDFAHRRLAFRDPAHLEKPAGAVEIPLKRVEGIRATPVSVEGGRPTDFDFDIGNGSPLLIFPAYEEAHHLLDGRRTSQALGGAVGGYHAETVTTVRRVTFAGVDFKDVPAVLTAATNSGVNSNLTLGNIGLPIIDRFHIIVDFSHDRAWLTPDPEQIAAPFVRDRLGMSIVAQDADLAVEFVSPGGPAEAMGFKAGDLITQIDRKPEAAWPAETLRALAQEPAGTIVEFTLSDGTVRRVRLADYY